MSGDTSGREETGRRGEEIAAGYLRDRGWTIRDRNWEADIGEIDLVAERSSAGADGGELVAVVEVKARSDAGGIPPEASVTRAKRRKLVTLAELYLAVHDLGAATVRFDVVAVELNGDRPSVDHFASAFDGRGRIR